MCGWRRTAWQPSAPWRRWCRSRRYRTGQTPRCAQRAATGVSNARARKCGRQAAWRGAAGARSSRPFELGLRPGSWPRAGWRNALRQRTTHDAAKHRRVGGWERRRRQRTESPASAPQSSLPAGGPWRGGGSFCAASRRVSSTPRRDGLGRAAKVVGICARATYVRWLCQGVARAAGGTACHARPLSGRAARPARAAERRQRGAAASRVARDIRGVRVLLCVSAGAMLHETLLALMGCTGDIFVDAPPECAPAAPRARRRARRPRNRVTLTRAAVQARAAGRRRGGGRGPAGGAAHRGGC